MSEGKRAREEIDTEVIQPSKQQKQASNSNASAHSAIDVLPDDCMLRVFEFLADKQLGITARVSKRWKKLSYDPLFWREIDLSMEADERYNRSIRSKRRQQLAALSLQKMKHFFSTPRGIHVLNLANNSNVTDALLKLIGKVSGPTLEELYLDGCEKVTSAGIHYISVSCSKLHTLHVPEGKIADKFIQSLARGVCPLRVLDCEGVLNMSSLAGIHELKHLEVLNLSYCRHLSSLATLCSNSLKRLDISHCFFITNPTCLQNLPKLEELSIQGITLKRLTEDRDWVASLKNLRVLSIFLYEGLSPKVITPLTQLHTLILDMVSNSVVSSRDIDQLFSLCPNVTEISFAWSQTEDYHSGEEFEQQWYNSRGDGTTEWVSGNNDVPEDTIQIISQHCHSLQEISFERVARAYSDGTDGRTALKGWCQRYLPSVTCKSITYGRF